MVLQCDPEFAGLGDLFELFGGMTALKPPEPASGNKAGYRVNAFAVNGMLQAVEHFCRFLESKGETGDRFQ